MADNWWDRFSYIAGAFARRIGEEAGYFDVAEEFQRYDDGDMSAVDWLKTSLTTPVLLGAARQTVDIPLQSLVTGAHEVNRAIGADLRATLGDEGWQGLLPSWSTNYDMKAYEDYFTGGFDTEEERAAYAKERGLSPNEAAAGYTPVSASDAYTIGVDKAINRYGEGVLWTPLAWPYAVGGWFNDVEGAQRNGSYLPRSFDMWAQDAGLQVWERSEMRHQLIAGTVVVEIAVDPLNFFAGPIAASIGGYRSARLVATTAKNMPDSAMVAQSLDVIANTAVENQRWLRFRQWAPGRGVWDPERMLKEMATNPNQRELLERLALEKDRTVLRRFLVNRRMADGDGADGLAGMMSALDKPEDVAALLYAASYRDETAIRRVLEALEGKVNTMPLADELKTQAGIATNPFEGASFMFGNGHLPDGHLLRVGAKAYVDEAIERHFAATNPAPGAKNTIRAQWDALADDVRKQYLDELAGHQTGMLAAEKVFERSNVARPLQRMANTRGDVALRKLERARAGDQRTMVRAVDWLTAKTPAIKINGRSSRTSASVWLMSRPGLTFSLHGMDAVTKFDDIIHYVDGILGPNPTTGANRQAAARFLDDDLVQSLRDRFVSAGAVSRSPEQIRAGLVDELQKHAIARIAQNRGAEYMAGQILADEGMKKAGSVADALNKVDTGYATVAIEDHIPLILANHPSAIRQTANHIPLMDLKAVDDALKSKGLQAYTSPDRLLSEAKVRGELDTMSATGRDRVARVGRGRATVATHTITDMADVGNTIFKMQVLLRLGYPVRNVSEAHLSAFASGVGWIQTLKAAGLTPSGMKFMVGNFMTNARHMPNRYIDRVQTNLGLVTNEDALVSVAGGLEAGSTMLANSILNTIRLGTDPATVTRAIRAYRTGTPQERAAAITELRTIAAWKASLAHHLDPEHPLVRDGVVAHDARQSGTFWHTDTTGALNGKVDPAKLDGPISVVSDRVVAQNQVDSNWGAAAPWQQADVGPGKVRGSWKIPGSRFAPLQRTELASLHAAQVAAGVKPKWRVAKDGSVTFTSTAGRDEFIAALDEAQAAPKPGLPVVKPATTDPGEQFWVKMTGTKGATGTPEQVAALASSASRTREADLLQVAADAKPGTHIWRSEVLSQSPHETGVTGIHWSVNPDGVVPVSNRQLASGQTAVVWHAQIEPDTTAFPRSHRIWSGKHRSMGHEAEVRLKPGSNIRVLGVRIGDDYFKINRRVVAEHKPNGQFYTIDYSDIDEIANAAPVAAPTVASLAEQQAAHAQKRAVLRNIRKKVDTHAAWRVRQQELATLAKDHHVQFRVNANSAWVDWAGPLPHKGGKAFGSYEFRTVAKPKGGGKPGTIKMEVWSPEVNLADPMVTWAAADRFADLDRTILGAAVMGDRAAQVRVSEVFAREGIYRLRLADSSKWNGEHILIHPKGVGDEAFTRMVNRNVEEAIRADLTTRHVNVPLLEKGMNLQGKTISFRPSTISAGQAQMRGRKATNQGGIGVDKTATPTQEQLNAMVGGTAPAMVTPEVTATEMLQRGGFTALMDELVDTAVHLRGQQEAVRIAYLQRRAKVAKNAKRPKGTPPALWKIASMYRGYYPMQDLLHGPDGGAYAQVTSGDLTQAQVYGITAHQGDLLNDMSRAIMNPEEITPGDPRFFEALSNLLGRQYRDMSGAVTPTGGVTRRDIDPVFARALERGDREALLNQTVDWVLGTTAGRDWLKGLNLKSAKDVPAAITAAEKAQARRGKIPLLTDADHRKVIRQNWQDGADSGARVDVADVVRATFAFADSHLPTQRVRDLFLSGQLDAASLQKAYDEEPWDLVAFNGLVTPTHPAFRQAMRQRAANQDALGVVSGGLTKFLGAALEKIGSGPETRLARHPVYLAIGKADLQQRISLAENTLGRELNMDELLELRAASQKFAVKKMEQTLYTLKSRSSVDDFLRFAVPFFPAWRNTMHRWGRFATENPAGVAQVIRLYDSTFGEMPWYDSATGHEVDPETAHPNEAYTLLPGLGSWIPWWKDDPVMGEAMRRTKVTKRSLDVIFQGDAFNPGAGPWIAVPIQAILTRKAELYNSPVGQAVAKWFLPIGPQQTGSPTLDAVSGFLPSAVKPLFNKAFGTQSFISTRNRIASTYYANGYHLNPDGSDKSSQQIDEEIDTATTKMLGVKTLMYLVSPVSAQQIGDHEFYAGQFRSLMEVSPDAKSAEDTFLERFGPDRWWYTRSSTSNLTGGMATGQVVANQKANEELAFEATEEFGDPRLLGFTDNLGPDGETMAYNPDDYNPYARNWQMQNKPGTSELPYRGTKGFAAYKDDAEVQLGWRYYDYGMGLLDLQLQNEGYQPGSPDFIKERGLRSSKVAGYVSQWAPQWAQSREVIDTAKTERNADYFNWLVNGSQWIHQQGRYDLPVMDSIRRYLADRESARAEIGRQKARNPDAGSTLGAASNEYVAMWLRSRREMYAQDSPSFEDWANRYFRNDGIQYEAPSLFPQEAITP